MDCGAKCDPLSKNESNIDVDVLGKRASINNRPLLSEMRIVSGKVSHFVLNIFLKIILILFYYYYIESCYIDSERYSTTSNTNEFLKLIG